MAPSPPESTAVLTLERIMADPDWLGNAPERPYWADDSKSFYYSRKKQGSEERELFQVALDGTQIRVVSDADRATADVPGGDISHDLNWKVYSRAGDLYLKDLRNGQVRQLTRTTEEEANPTFLWGDDRIAFRRGGALFIRTIADGFEFQPADLRTQDDPDKKKDEEADPLKKQQQRLFDFIQERKRREDEAKERDKRQRDADPLRAPQPWYFGNDVEIRDSGLSPSGKWMLVRLVKKAGGDADGKRDAMPQYVSESGYVESREVRSKVGTGKPRGEQLVLLDLEKHERHELDPAVLPGITDDPLKAIREAAEQRAKERKDACEWLKQPSPDDPAGRAAEPALVDARWLLENGYTRSAVDRLSGWIERHAPRHPESLLAYRLRGDALTLDAYPYRALYDYERLAKEGTGTPQFALAIERELEIGVRFLKMGMARVESGEAHNPRDDGQELLIRVAERLPGSPLAERAMVALADGYFANAEYELAIGGYEIALTSFPNSAEAARVRERLEKLKRGEQPAAAADPPKADEKKEEPPKPRPVTFDIAWCDDGSRVVVQAQSLDSKDRWIAAVDLESKKLAPLERDTDEAWINGRFTNLGWPRGKNDTIWFQSERTGYGHLYLRPIDPALPAKALTEGLHEVTNVSPSRDGRHLYYTANAAHPGVHETWRVDIATFVAERLTELGGAASSIPSPDGAHLLITHSRPTRPAELYIQPAQPDAGAKQVTRTTSEDFLNLPWQEPDVVAIPSRHGAEPIYARVYTPVRSGASPRPPAVVFIHGAGYLQNAHKGWSSYFREYMFHNLLAQRGFVVLDMDYRASAGYGREWRRAIYRRMGTPELEDLEDGVAWLAEHKDVDPVRVGCYGGSYGGFLTLMALFTKPDLFACGAALRPVTDWAHYNHGYTANILNTPADDPEAFERSSPIEFAAGLKRPLLICHGMQDDNVFFQDTVRLAQRLIELEKQDWEVAVYPVEPHAFQRPSSWLDEYRRILELFERHLKPTGNGP